MMENQRRRRRRTATLRILLLQLLIQLVWVFATLLGATLGASVAEEDSCKALVKPLVLDSHSPIYGKWVLHVGAWDQPALKDDLSTVKSSWVELSASASDDHLTIYWADRLKEDQCLQGVANGSVSGTSSHTTFNINGHTSYHEGKYYDTCGDCLLSEDTTLLPDGETKGRYLFLFTRTGQLDASELEKFKRQAECLKMYPEYHLGGPDLCPDKREPMAKPAENPEATPTEATEQ